MTGLMTIFLIIGAIGFLFLLISLVVGDVFEAFGFDFDPDLDGSGDFGLFDSRVIAIFLTAFGGGGTIAAALGYGTPASLGAGFLGGIVFGAIVFYFGKFLHSQQASSAVRLEEMLGRSAEVIVSIKPGQVGQISCRVGEERIEKLARARDGREIKAGALVRIDSIASDSVIVSADDGDGFSLFSEKA